MDFVLHQLTHGFIDHAVTLHKTLSGKRRADDAHRKMAAAFGAGVTGVFVAVVDDFDDFRSEGFHQAFADQFSTVGRIHGSTLRNGLTLTLA